MTDQGDGRSHWNSTSQFDAARIPSPASVRWNRVLRVTLKPASRVLPGTRVGLRLTRHAVEVGCIATGADRIPQTRVRERTGRGEVRAEWVGPAATRSCSPGPAGGRRPRELRLWPGQVHVFPIFGLVPEARLALDEVARFVAQIDAVAGAADAG